MEMLIHIVVAGLVFVWFLFGFSLLGIFVAMLVGAAFEWKQPSGLIFLDLVSMVVWVIATDLFFPNFIIWAYSCLRRLL